VVVVQVADEHIGDIDDSKTRLHQTAQRAVTAVDEIRLTAGQHNARRLRSREADVGTALRPEKNQRRSAGRSGCAGACAKMVDVAATPDRDAKMLRKARRL
jgi:hypothetical protein